MKLSFKFIVIHVILPIFIASLIYIFWRSTTLMVFRWLEFLALDGLVNLLRTWTMPFQNHLPDWVLYNLPDGLWVYAVTAFMVRLWGHDLSDNKDKPETKESSALAVTLWSSAGLVMGIGLELAQYLGIMAGVYDFQDVSVCAFAAFAALLTSRSFCEVSNNENKK